MSAQAENNSGWRLLRTQKVCKSSWAEYDARQLRRLNQQKKTQIRQGNVAGETQCECQIAIHTTQSATTTKETTMTTDLGTNIKGYSTTIKQSSIKPT